MPVRSGYCPVRCLAPLPPTAALKKIFCVGAIGLVLGIVLDLSRETPRITRLFAAVVAAPALVWIGWPRLLALDIGDTLTILAAVVAAAAVLPRLYGPRAAGAETATELLVRSEEHKSELQSLM